MAQDGFELVFEKPHSNIFPTMDQSHPAIIRYSNKPAESLNRKDRSRFTPDPLTTGRFWRGKLTFGNKRVSGNLGPNPKLYSTQTKKK
ncbi:hypothetical protein OUZ56_011970 [Daphnia magna]|uniref:Uncharacterized protein n=1 Tax=Daphnia magna TaxID=35525 RepID=A0ABQ9Z1N7_9CRUS|nr:hypothetical protein OUZ56_011970 [Daphnia magna]